jgi:hypothetical protein
MQFGDLTHVLRDLVQHEPNTLRDELLIRRKGRGSASRDARQRRKVALEHSSANLDRSLALQLLLVVGTPVEAFRKTTNSEHVTSLSFEVEKKAPSKLREKGKKERVRTDRV